ncbi:MAG: DegT/DnrJ/EryC1/StrS family aminotransferase [Pseudomonadota bacterium]
MSELKNPVKYLGNEFEYIKKVLEGENWSATTGNWNQSLENQLAKLHGVNYAIALNSGTATLHAALEAGGVKPGDEVISPGLTVIMDTTATLHANAVPVYADIDPDTFSIDPEDIKRKITNKTKAIITVAIYGLAPDMDPVMEIAKENNLIVIEDNAQALFSKYKGRLLGTIGHMASYSFENTKHISCGEGGAVITDDEQFAQKVRKIGGHGYKNLRAQEGRIRLNAEVFQNPNYKRHDMLGWNYRLNEFSAAIALAQLERAGELINLRKESAKIFMDVMAQTDYLIPQKTPEEYENTYYTLGVKYEGGKKQLA